VPSCTFCCFDYLVRWSHGSSFAELPVHIIILSPPMNWIFYKKLKKIIKGRCFGTLLATDKKITPVKHHIKTDTSLCYLNGRPELWLDSQCKITSSIRLMNQNIHYNTNQDLCSFNQQSEANNGSLLHPHVDKCFKVYCHNIKGLHNKTN